MIGPLYAIPSIFIFDIMMKNIFKKHEIKMCNISHNTQILGIKYAYLMINKN
jgi:hypothetical protein